MDAVFDNLDAYRQGFVTTLELSVLSSVLALLLGTVLAAMRVSRSRPSAPRARPTSSWCATRR